MRKLVNLTRGLVVALTGLMSVGGVGVSRSVAQDQAGADARWIRVVEEKDGATIKLELAARSYAKENGPTVWLTGAVHVADDSFYSELQKFLDAKDVVLFEGVKPPGAGNLDHEAVNPGPETLAKATKRRIRFVATFVEKYRKDHKAYPTSLEQLVGGVDGRMSKLLSGCLNDAWGHPLVFALKPAPEIPAADPDAKKDPGTFEITSLGADGKPAGDGVDADLMYSQQPPIKRGEIEQGEGIQRQIASAMRLKFQLDAMDETKPNWRNSDLSVDQVMDRLEAAGADGNQLFSMIGGGSMMDTIIGGVARLLGSFKSVSTLLRMVMVDMLSNADALLAGTGGEMGKMMEVIIQDRNKVVIDDLARVLKNEPNVKTIGIIYGAGHLSDMEKRITTDLGFKESGERWFTAITVNVADTGMGIEDVRDLRKQMRTSIDRQLKSMQPKKPRESAK